MAGESFDGIALLIEDLQADDTDQRVKAMSRLRTVAKTLGPSRTVSELVPFLSEQVEDDDEVLLTMAEQLGDFGDLVGGSHASVCLLELLGNLATVEETVVREKAVASINKVVGGLSSDDTVEHALPVILRLSKGDWFTSRVSACGLFATAYAQVVDGDTQSQLRALFKDLATEDTPMVRRAAARNVGKLATSCSPDAIVSELMPVFMSLVHDEQDSVRLLAIESCTTIAVQLGEEGAGHQVLPIVMECAEDKSWRVRNNIARSFHALSEALGKAATVSKLLPIYSGLLGDAEGEVRTSAVKSLRGMTELVGADLFVAQLVPRLGELAADVAMGVRQSTAEQIMEVVPVLGGDVTETHLLPHIMTLVRDEAAEVRHKIVAALNNLVTTVDHIEGTLLPALATLSSDTQWRVRQDILKCMPLLASALGSAAFDSNVLPLYSAALVDQVSCVRRAAAAVGPALARELGADWCATRLTPKLIQLWEAGGGYLYRITVLYCIEALASDPELVDAVAETMPYLTAGARDPVPNVRFVAARVMGSVLPAVDKARADGEIRPALASLKEDGDKDVAYFASVALS